MPVDVLYVQPYLLFCRDLKLGGVKNAYYATIEGRVNMRYVRNWMREVDFVANSYYTRDKLLEAGFRVLDVVHHGVDLKEVEKARKMKHVGAEYMADHGLDPSKHFVILTISNPHPRKGLAWLDKVIGVVEQKDPSIKFLVVTEEKGKSYFEKHDNLIIATDFGKLPRTTVLALIASAHALVVPSLSEGFGLPVLEAMALGTPVIHAELPPLMEFSVGFTVPAKEILYFDRHDVGPSGIIFEQYLYDVEEFAETLLQVVDYYRSKKDAIIDYRRRAWERAKKLSIYRTYPRLLKHLVDGIPSEIDDGVAVYDIEKLPEIPSIETAIETSPQPTETLDLDALAKEILSGVGKGSLTKPILYPGGDWFIKNDIIDLLVKSGCTVLVEVFGGSGVISMYAPRDKFKVIVYNDIDDLLVNFFTVLKEKPQELIKRLALLPVSRTIYEKYANMYRSGEIHKLDPVEKATAFFYLNRVSFSGFAKSFGIKCERSIAKDVKKAVMKLEEYAKMWADVVIENRDFRQIIKTYDRPYTVFYCDPPFLPHKVKNRKEYYRFTFTENDMKDLLNMLSSIKGKFVLKLPHDHLEVDFIREWANRYRIKEVEHALSLRRVINTKRSRFKTLLVYNYDA
jgi:DNA adenine methylase